MSRKEDPPVEDIESEEESSEEESSDEEAPEEPATPSNTDQPLPEVTSQLYNLHLEMGDNNPRGRNPTPAPTNDRVAGTSGSFKVNPPSEFSGQRNQVKTFKLQCLTYLHLNNDKLNTDRKRLLFLTSYLRAAAYEWILPHLEDYLEYPDAVHQKATTRAIMADPATFFTELQTTFGYGSERMEAERALQSIQQRGPVSKYKAEFLTLVVKTNWDDNAIASHFYRGLKDAIKDEIARRDTRPATAQEMYEVALKIDERFYERQMEKKGFYPGRANTKAPREVPAWRDNYYGLQKMQIDATNGKPGSGKKNNKKGRNPQATKGTKDKSKVECYACHQKGHYSNECKARKQTHDLQKSGQKQQFNATKGKKNKPPIVENAKSADDSDGETRIESFRATTGRGAYDLNGANIAEHAKDSHAALTWTACYDDGCAIHYSDKYDSGYWPVRATRSVCRTLGQPGQVVRYPAGYPPQQDSTSEDEDEEDSSEEEGEVSEIESEEPEVVGTTEFTRTADSNDVIHRVLAMTWESKSLVFPWNADGDEQLVNESEFWIMVGKIRAILWNMPHEKHSVDHLRIVQEFPPLGSQFTDRGGYFTPTDICISRSLRTQVMDLKRAYALEGRDQARRVSDKGKAIAYSEQRPSFILPERYGEAPTRPLQTPPTSPLRERVKEGRPTRNIGASTDEQSASAGSSRTNEYLVNPVGLQINWAKYPIQPRDAGN
ncbi:Cytochrome P450 monooxygenase-like protein [Venturia nashicola]|nr:Cytochrome P450 monooxygenase-like protein [Venturia nashicola]